MTEALTQQQVVGSRYQVQRTLGKGGMAIVSLADDILLGRQVALKTLQPAYAYDRAFVERFRREAQAAARLGHPNIVRIYDLLQSPEGTPVIVMEYVAGHSLQDALRRAGPPPLSLALALVRQVSAALEEAHRSGLVHRDIKPGNLLLTRPLPANDWNAIPIDEDGALVKVVDFGIARAAGERSLSLAGEVWGSAHYLSPEQARGEPATAASDVYGLGCVLFELLTGRAPFQGETAMAVAIQHSEAPRPAPRSIDPTLPPSLDHVVLRAMAKEPAQRFASAHDLGEALRLLEEIGLDATGPMSVTPSRTTSRQASRARSQTATRQAAPALITERAPVRRRRGSFLQWLSVIPLTLALIGILAYAAQQFIPGITGQTEQEAPPQSTTPIASLFALPTVQGLPMEQARAQLEGLGLVVNEGDKLFSEDVPAGAVMNQSPGPGAMVRPGSTVTLFLSQGPQKVTMPQVVGKTFGEAQAQLEALGLKVERKESPKAGAQQEEVIAQEPVGGAVARDSTVVLSVNPGGLAQVPEAWGKTEAEAKRLIQAAGLVVSPNVNYQSRRNTDIPINQLEAVCRGCVLSVSPRAGEAVQPGREVHLAVRDLYD